MPKNKNKKRRDFPKLVLQQMSYFKIVLQISVFLDQSLKSYLVA